MTRNIWIGVFSFLIVIALGVMTFIRDQEDLESGLADSGPPADTAGQETRPSPPVADQSTRPSGSDQSDSVQPDSARPSDSLKKDNPVAQSSRGSAVNQPHFDVVRIAPDGAAVLAGRAPPGMDVHIYRGSDVVGMVRADKRGEWVWIPERPFPPGQLELTLRAYQSGSKDFIESSEVVLMVLPERKPGTDRAALVVKVDRDGEAPSQLIQLPSGQSAAVDLSLDTVDYGGDGALVLSGRAIPGSRLRLQLDGQRLGEAVAGEDSRWTLSPDRKVTAGDYLLRIERLDAEGQVIGHLELPFHRASQEQIARAVIDPGNWVVQPGNSLWRIARNLYGKGTHFTIIYEANRSKINHPDLIYPGQIFATPSDVSVPPRQ